MHGHRSAWGGRARKPLTIITGGLWGFVWLALALGQRDNRVFLEADRWGNVWARATAPG